MWKELSTVSENKCEVTQYHPSKEEIYFSNFWFATKVFFQTMNQNEKQMIESKTVFVEFYDTKISLAKNKAKCKTFPNNCFFPIMP